jgi:hypothetical protein
VDNELKTPQFLQEGQLDTCGTDSLFSILHGIMATVFGFLRNSTVCWLYLLSELFSIIEEFDKADIPPKRFTLISRTDDANMWACTVDSTSWLWS